MTRPVWLDSLEISFTASESGGNPLPQSLKIKNYGPATQEATYSATITIIYPGAYNNPQKVNVSLKITKEPPPEIWLSSTELTFNAKAGSNPSPQSLRVRNSRKGNLNYGIISDASWSIVNPTSRSSNGQENTHTASMKRQRLQLCSMIWKRSLSILFGLTILLAVQAFATDYYVDPTNGNDANNGTSSSTAWKTVANVNNSMSIFAPGDRVLFKRGETFTGAGLVIRKGGTPGNPLVFGAYGTGNKPLFSGYSTESAIITQAANISDIVLEDIAVRNVSGTGNMGIGFTADNNKNITIRRCDVEAVGHTGIVIGCVDGYIVEDCTVRNCGNAGICVLGDLIYSAKNGVIRNCIVDGVTDNDGITLHMGDTIDCNLGPNHLIENNVCSNCGEQGIDITSGSYITLRSNRTSANGQSGIVIAYNVRNVWIDKHISQNESGRGIYILDSSFVKLTSSIIYNSAGQSLDISNCTNFEAYNNTIIHSSTNPPYLMDISGTVQNLTFKNNIFTSVLASTPSSFVRYLLGTTPASTRSSFSRNLWWKPNLTSITDMFYDDSLARYNFNTWQSTYGKDEGILINDPQLVSPQSQDFHIKSSSPCIDRGVDVGLSSDFYGTPIPQGLAPDIGAAEYNFSSSLIASASASPTSGPAPSTVAFTGGASGGVSPYTCSWRRPVFNPAVTLPHLRQRWQLHCYLHCHQQP